MVERKGAKNDNLFALTLSISFVYSQITRARTRQHICKWTSMWLVMLIFIVMIMLEILIKGEFNSVQCTHCTPTNKNVKEMKQHTTARSLSQ